MSHTLAPAGPPTEEDLELGGPPSAPPTRRSGLLGLSLHALMLLAALAGIAYTNAGGPHFKYVWIALAPFYGLICIFDGLRVARSGRERVRLVVTQVLHWLAFLVVMYLMFLPRVEGVMNEDAAAIGLLVILALGTFVAGVHAWSWRVCVVGIFLALAVPAMAWIDETGLLLTVAGLAIMALVVVSFLAYRWEARRWRGR
jgi:hypothetical protein